MIPSNIKRITTSAVRIEAVVVFECKRIVSWAVILSPLSLGKHILHYTTGYKIPFAAVGGANQEGYIQDVTYNLIVKPTP
jgi:hypothetical protein